MPVHNADIATAFEQIADLLEIENANPFRVRAYRNAARQLQGMGVPVADMLAKGEDLTELPAIATTWPPRSRRLSKPAHASLSKDYARRRRPPSRNC